MQTVKIKKLNDNAIIPKKAHDDDAGFDLYACIPDPIVIHPHKTILIGTVSHFLYNSINFILYINEKLF